MKLFYLKGFTLRYEEKSLSCGETIMLSDEYNSTVISSPNYPNIPPGHIECIWQIFAPSGESIHFDVHQRFDMTSTRGYEFNWKILFIVYLFVCIVVHKVILETDWLRWNISFTDVPQNTWSFEKVVLSMDTFWADTALTRRISLLLMGMLCMWNISPTLMFLKMGSPQQSQCVSSPMPWRNWQKHFPHTYPLIVWKNIYYFQQNVVERYIFLDRTEKFTLLVILTLMMAIWIALGSWLPAKMPL